jgi:putative ABC transport system ATP-binding protein
MIGTRDRRGAGPATAKVHSVHRLTKTYETGGGEIHALRGIDLDLFAGEFIVLLGPSGCGKSTLLQGRLMQ